MHRTRAGFTLIELLIVVVIIGILAAVAIPKFAATKDKAKLASVKSDVRSAEVAQEAYYSDYKTYGTLAQLRNGRLLQLSPGNTMSVSRSAAGYTITASNTSIGSSISKCTVRVGKGAASSLDGKITCP